MDHQQCGSRQTGRDASFKLRLRDRWIARRLAAAERKLEDTWAAKEPGEDCTDEAWVDWNRHRSAALNRAHERLCASVQNRQERYRVDPKPQRAIFPGTRRREHRPAGTRRVSSSSTTSGTDPGDDGPSSRTVVLTFAVLTADQCGAVIA